ncbi:hypothetical protein BG015_000391 [Linnemannia schmuckeri]|uniref:HMG box domain-containing protein n=1 Tax=Linnemannia schmuckeri TaxID=64567 RepID=A0A9P5VE15_9FUNG|nr:hypothetical protein BG015_000391 [Linnemannia schmuckeri]
MAHLAFQGMTLNTAKFNSSSLASAATNSTYSSLEIATLGSSASSLPLAPSPKLTHVYYPESTDPYLHSIKLETIEPPTYGSSHSPAIILDTSIKKVPRPPNSFIIYRREHSANYSKITAAELSKILGEQWAKEPPERKAYYAKLAKAAEKEHALKYPDYKFTPAKRGTGRRAKTIRAAVSAGMKATSDSPKPRTYKPSSLSTLAPVPPSPSPSPQSISSHPAMPSLHHSPGNGVSQQSAFPCTITITKNNPQASTHLARLDDIEDYRFHYSKSSQSGAQRSKPRHAVAHLRPRPSTSTVRDASYCHAAPEPFELDTFPSLNFGLPHLLPQSQGVTSSSSLSSPGLPASSLLFDPVVPTNWQWTPPTPATPSQFAMSAMTPSSFHGQSQSSPLPLSQEMAQQVNLPAFDYFALQDPGRPATFAMNWPHKSPLIVGTPLPISGDGATAAVSGDDDCAPASYQWGVEAAVPTFAWSNPEAIYGANLPTPVSPEFRASMNIPIPSAKQQHHRHHYHLQNYHSQMMPLNHAAAGFAASMMVDQNMSISPVLSSCSSSYSSLYSLNEQQTHLPQPFLFADLALDPIAVSKTATTTASGTSSITLLDLEQKNAKPTAATAVTASQIANPSPVTYKSFV